VAPDGKSVGKTKIGRKNQMKKAISLALALVLCLGLLCVPAGATGLDAAAAKAYLDALTEAIKDRQIVYTELVDMEGSGSLELVMISSEKGNLDETIAFDLHLDVWAMRGGSSTHTVAASLGGRQEDLTVRRIKKGGKCYYRISEADSAFGFVDWTNKDRIFGVDGLLYEDQMHFVKSNEEVRDGSYREEYKKLYAIYESKMVQYLDENNTTELALYYEGAENGMNSPMLATVQKQLADAASTTTNTATATQYGTYQINYTGDDFISPYVVTFSSAKVEKKTVSLCNTGSWDYEEAMADPGMKDSITFGQQSITQVTLRPDCKIQVVGGGVLGTVSPNSGLPGFYANKLEENRYWYGSGAGIGAVLDSGIARDLLGPDTGCLVYTADELEYLIVLGNNAPSAPTAYVSTQTVSVDGKKSHSKCTRSRTPTATPQITSKSATWRRF